MRAFATRFCVKPNRSMSPRDLVYVGHMLDIARKAVSKTAGVSREAFDADENLRLALIHLIQVIGEAAGRHGNTELSNASSDRCDETASIT
jgi:uncharacterized protein with HEPN domain